MNSISSRLSTLSTHSHKNHAGDHENLDFVTYLIFNYRRSRCEESYSNEAARR